MVPVQGCRGQLGSPAASLLRRRPPPLDGDRSEPCSELSCPLMPFLGKAIEESGAGRIARFGRDHNDPRFSRRYPL